jgi:hypothetical protein
MIEDPVKQFLDALTLVYHPGACSHLHIGVGDGRYHCCKAVGVCEQGKKNGCVTIYGWCPFNPEP